MSLDRSHGLNDQISHEAAQWLVDFRTGDVDPAARRDFDSWLRTSPEHIRAFIEMAALWHASGAIDPPRQLDIEQIIARARSEENIVTALIPTTMSRSTASSPPVEHTLPRTAAHVGPRNDGNRRARAARWAIAASLLLTFLTGLLVRSELFGPPTYATGVRARRSISLPDGSTVLLDSRSRLRVSFTETTRTVELLQGQALFDVVKNPRQPFLVHVGSTVVRDIGTVFDVNRLGDGTIVTVVEGRVAVATPSSTVQGRATPTLPEASFNNTAGTAADRRAAQQPIYLSAGEQLSVDVGHYTPRPMRVNVSSETAWTHGNVVLESATLSEVAQVFNRYSARRMVATDLGAKPFRLSGVFATDPGFLIQYLRARPDIVVTETGSEIVIVRGAAKQ